MTSRPTDNTIVREAKQKAAAFDALVSGTKKALPLFLTSLLSTGTIIGGGVAVGAIPTNGAQAAGGIEAIQADLAAIKASVSVIPTMQADVAILKTDNAVMKAQLADLVKRVDRMEDRRQ